MLNPSNWLRQSWFIPPWKGQWGYSPAFTKNDRFASVTSQ